MTSLPLKELLLPFILLSICFANGQSGFGEELRDLSTDFPTDLELEAFMPTIRDVTFDDSTDLPAISTQTTPTTSEEILTTSQHSKIDIPLNIYEVILKFLDSVKDSCEFLKHLSVVLNNDLSHRRMQYFEDIQLQFFDKLTKENFGGDFRKRHQEVRNATTELWTLLSESKEWTENLESFFINNVYKNHAMGLMNAALDENFMSNLKQAAEMGLKDYSSECQTSTPSQMLYDFYIGGVFWVLKENALFSLAADQMNNAILKTLVTNSFKFHWLNSVFDQKLFSTAIKSTSVKTYINLQPSNNRKFVGFETFLQRFINAEKNINGGSCDYRCDWITRMEYKSDGCYGELRRCEIMKIHDDYVEIVFSKNTTRIHDVKTDNSKATKLYQYNTALIFGYNCDICRCICDQKWHNKTQRYLYAGRSDARLGYAITGVRFAKAKGVIFLQIQSGKLNKDGYVDEDTVYWSDAPADLTTNVHTLTYDNRKLSLSELKFENAILTGLQITERKVKNFDTTIALRIFGKSFKNFNDDEFFALNSKSSERDLTIEDLRAGTARAPNASYKLTFGGYSSVAVQFETNSLIDRMGQETIPQFNAEDVTLSPMIPAAGIGLLHYTDSAAFGGYVKPYLLGFIGDV